MANVSNEGLVHLGSWPDGNDFVYLSRDGASSRVVFAIGDASSSRDHHVACSIASDNGTIVAGQWMTLVARYSAVSNSVDLLKDGRYGYHLQRTRPDTPRFRIDRDPKPF